MAARCDDGNPCTVDICGVTGCIHTVSEGTRCNDGLFCNGVDSCGSDGNCSVHNGDPCVGNLTCDEGLGTCVGCDETSPCPEASEEVSECDFSGLGVCEQIGSRTRTTTTYACVDRVCIPSESQQNEACIRRTEDAACDDGNACTRDDKCKDGACTGTLRECAADLQVDPSDPCVDVACDPGSGCLVKPTENRCEYQDLPVESLNRDRDCRTYQCRDGVCQEHPARQPAGTVCQDPVSLQCGTCNPGGVCSGLDAEACS